MAFILPDLPYAKTAFGTVISEKTFDFHHGKHHKAYVDKTNSLVGDAGLASASLAEVIKTAKDKGNKGLFNNAAQIWNHSFYWLGLSPDKKTPNADLQKKIDASFGSTEKLCEALKNEAVGHFASGWAWLVLDGDALKVTSLHDADTPLVHGLTPLLTLDVWEHAYYLDYQNARPGYVDALLANAINWDFVAQNLDGKGISRADQQG